MEMSHQASQITEIESGYKEVINIHRLVPLVLQMRDLQVRICFGIVQNLAVHALLETTLKTKCILGIFLVGGKVILENLAPISMPKRGTEASMINIMSCEEPIDQQIEY